MFGLKHARATQAAASPSDDSDDPASNPSLTDLRAWRKRGEELGRLNSPAGSTESAPIREALRALLLKSARNCRLAHIRAVDGIDAARANARERVAEAATHAVTDARMRQNLSGLENAARRLDAARAMSRELFLAELETLRTEAVAADTAWREANQRQRDRRIVLAPTDLDFPAELLAEVPDPLS